MISKKRLAEISSANPVHPKSSLRELAKLTNLYKITKGLEVLKDENGVWLRINAPSGKYATLNMNYFSQEFRGIAQEAIQEWIEAFE